MSVCTPDCTETQHGDVGAGRWPRWADLSTQALERESCFHLMAVEEFRDVTCVQKTPCAVVLWEWIWPLKKEYGGPPGRQKGLGWQLSKKWGVLPITGVSSAVDSSPGPPDRSRAPSAPWLQLCETLTRADLGPPRLGTYRTINRYGYNL